MNLKPGSPFRAALLTLAVLCAPAALAGEDAPYPIWWSPELELVSLDKIDERLERPLYPNEKGFRMFVGIGSNRRTEIAKSCADIRRLEEEASGAIESPDFYLWLTLYRDCSPIERFMDAKQAVKSNVANFTLNADALNYLPAMLLGSPACEGLCRLYDANHDRIPLARRLQRPFDLVITSPYEITIESEDDVIHIEILGRADFNDDGLEDIFLRSIVKPKEGRWGSHQFFTLVRDESDGVFWVMDAEDYVCSPISYHLCETQ